MAIQGIEGVLQQMQAMAIQAGNNGQNSVPQGVSFASELTAALVNQRYPAGRASTGAKLRAGRAGYQSE